MVNVHNNLSQSSLAERHLGLIAAVVGLLGMIAICGSPGAVLGYAEDLAGAIWAVACAIVG